MPTPQIHFVISAPRSGSTWLARTLNHHPEIFATEQRLFGNFFEVWPNNNGRPAPRLTLDAYARAMSVHYFHQHTSNSRDQFVDEFIEEYSAFMTDFAFRKTGKSIIVDKITPYPGTSRTVIERIKKFFPNSKIIQLIRDGRDVVTSGTFDWLLKDAEGTQRHKYFVEKDASVKMDRFFDDEVLTSWAENWKETVQIFRNTAADFRITYESMLSDQPAVIKSLANLLDVDGSVDLALNCCQPESFAVVTGRSNGQMDPMAKQRNGVAGDWARYMTRHDGAMFHSVAGKQLIDEGYADDANWLENLPEKLQFKNSEAIQ